MAKKLTVKKGGDRKGKAQLKTEGALRLSILCGVGRNYASKQKDMPLYEKFDYTLSYLQTLRDVEFIDTGDVLLNLAAEQGKGWRAATSRRHG